MSLCLEQPVRDIEFGSAVKYGTYQVNCVWSPKFHRYMLRLDVPHRCGILIHAGNSVKDTTGCILLGENKVVGRLLITTEFTRPFHLASKNPALSDIIYSYENRDYYKLI